jgi:catechol 2,3-dioxygenase-like lactoylglutathione lyase family enzyme
MSHFEGIDHIDLAVENFDEMVKFFRGLGFVDVRERTDSESVELRVPGGTGQPFLELRGTVRKNGDVIEPGLRHIAMRVPDLEAAYEDLLSRGYKFNGVPRLVSSGRTVVGLIDPEGNQLQLVSAG